MLQWIGIDIGVIVIYFLVQKSAIFAYVWAIFPVIAFLVSFIHWIFFFQAI